MTFIIDVENANFSVIDLAGSPPASAEDILLSSSHHHGSLTYIVTPPFAVLDIKSDLRPCLTLEKSIFPHLDLDHIGESINAGWKDGLSLEIYRVKAECLHP